MVEVIAEFGSNHCGSIEIVEKLIAECKLAGADACKLQIFRASDLYDENHPHWSQIVRSQVSREFAETCFDYAHSMGIEMFASVFFPEAVKWLESLPTPPKRYKIASRTIALKDRNSMEVLEAVAKTGKPVIVSTGYGYDHKLLAKLFKENVRLLYCKTEYPVKDEDLHLSVLRGYHGFSDHSLGITASIAAVTLGAKIIEKHVKLPESTGPDAAFSITVDELKELIKHIRRVEVILS